MASESPFGMEQLPARPSWRDPQDNERLKDFVSANRWQREAIATRVNAQNGFLVLIGLFVVLVLENLSSFDPDEFASEGASILFLICLVLGSACGVFTIFSTTLVSLKLQRLIVRDIAALEVQQPEVQQVAVTGNLSRLDRLANLWAKSSTQHQFHPACLSYDWYHGGGLSWKGCFKNKNWNPSCPRTLIRYATFSFATTVVSSLVALAIKLADTTGIALGACSFILFAAGTFLPVAFVRAGCSAPEGLRPSENPFCGF